MSPDSLKETESTDESVLIITLYLNEINKVFIPLCYSDKFTYPTWRIPGGGVNPGEITLVAAERELSEETGLILFIIKEMPEWLIQKPSRKNLGEIHFQHVFTGVTKTKTFFKSIAKDGEEILTTILFPLEEVRRAVLCGRRLRGLHILLPHRRLLAKAIHTNFGLL